MTLTTIIIIILLLFLLLLLFFRRRGGAVPVGVPTGTGPIRVPTVTVAASVSPTFPRCDGSFEGAGSVTAVYPGVGAGPPATLNITLKLVDENNVDVDFFPDPGTIVIDGPAASPKGYNFKGNLKDKCLNGDFKVQATVENVSAAPPTRSVISSPVVNVNAVGFKIVSGIDVAVLTNDTFRVKFTLGCCGAAPKVFVADARDQVNVQSLVWTPANRKLTCPGADVNFVIDGTKTPESKATFALNVKDTAPGGHDCRLGLVQIEDR